MHNAYVTNLSNLEYCYIMLCVRVILLYQSPFYEVPRPPISVKYYLP